jgi:hypothetical protein
MQTGAPPDRTGAGLPPSPLRPVERVGEAVHDRVVETVAEIKPRLRGWLHAGTTPLAFVSFLVMLVLADDTAVRAGVAVFMISALLLFGTSAIYHTHTWSPRRTHILKRIDHANIFVLIAGSSTPFAIMLLPQRHAVWLILVMWCGPRSASRSRSSGSTPPAACTCRCTSCSAGRPSCSPTS